jgi:hypothetical protein
VADPRLERGASAATPDGAVPVRLRSGRPPRPANDNVFPRLKQLPRLLPLLAAVALLGWALIRAFGAR